MVDKKVDALVKSLRERESVVAALKANGGKLVLYFDYDTADISSQANQEIMKHIAFMQDNICNLLTTLPLKSLLPVRNRINFTCTSVFDNNCIGI
jgi:hypothetical protein